eukprot:GHVH01006319.1.p1 GENE.GHVH01006319.1~~GHVH01006319.1.p1  ORF type:complete len:478 (+),score=57.02 GHVH01006319.1:11-1444(+)
MSSHTPKHSVESIGGSEVIEEESEPPSALPQRNEDAQMSYNQYVDLFQKKREMAHNACEAEGDAEATRDEGIDTPVTADGLQIYISHGIGYWSGYEMSACDRMSVSELGGSSHIARPLLTAAVNAPRTVLARPSRIHLEAPPESVHEVEDAPLHERSCILCGFDSTLDSRTVTAQLKEFGLLRKVLMVHHPVSGRSLGTALVEFQTKSGCCQLMSSMDASRITDTFGQQYTTAQRLFANVYYNLEGATELDNYYLYLDEASSIDCLPVPESADLILSSIVDNTIDEEQLKTILSVIDSKGHKSAIECTSALWNMYKYGHNFREFISGDQDKAATYDQEVALSRSPKQISYTILDPADESTKKLLVDHNWIHPKIQNLINKLATSQVRTLRDTPLPSDLSASQRNPWSETTEQQARSRSHLNRTRRVPPYTVRQRTAEECNEYHSGYRPVAPPAARVGNHAGDGVVDHRGGYGGSRGR